jgi:hypothetical protein
MKTVRKSNLTVISPPGAPAAPPKETASERIRRLQAEARTLARGQLLELETAMRELASLCEEIAEGGDAYPIGARELASRMAEELDARAGTLKAIVSRA